MNDVALDKTKACLFAWDVLVLLELESFLIEERAFKNIQEYSEKGKRGSRMKFAYKWIVVKESLQEYQKDIQKFSEIFLKCLTKKLEEWSLLTKGL